jgi:hypothetical protein
MACGFSAKGGRRISCILAALALPASSASLARADAAAPAAALEVTRAADAADCPDAPTLAAAVARIQGRDVLDVAPDSRAPVHIDVRFGKNSGSYVATIAYRGNGSAMRTIPGSTRGCSGLADAVAATLSLVVDAIPATQSAGEASQAQQPPAQDPAPAATPAPSPPPEADPSDYPEGLGDEARQHHRRHPPLPKNGLFFELLGLGLLYSLNYERFLGEDARFSVRAGFSYLPALYDIPGALHNDPMIDRVEFPVAGNYYLGRDSHRWQVGAGALFNASPGGASPVMPALLTGYRYLHSPDGFQFGITLSCLFATGSPSVPVNWYGLATSRLPAGMLPWAGLSFGAGF